MPTAATTEPLPTVDIVGLEVFSAGTFNGDAYSEADLDSMVTAFDKVGFKPTVKAGHADGQEDEKTARKIFGAPALGYVSKLYRKGGKLLADITKVPRRFANLIKSGAYSRISSEVYWNFLDNDAKTKHPRVLKSVAFLGADVPAITNLREVEALYSRNDTGGLYAYDEAKNEYRIYTSDVTDPPPALARYKEEGTFEIKPGDNGQFCVYSPAGELIKCWPNQAAAEKSVEGYNFKVLSQDDSPDLHTYVIRKKGSQWCLMTHDGSKTLGCHDTEEEAMTQERAVQASKHSHADGSVWVTADEMTELCKPCAESMKEHSLRAVRVGTYAADGTFKFEVNLPEKTKAALCDKFGANEGFRTRCMVSSVAKNVEDPGAFCNALKLSCFGDSQAAKEYQMEIVEEDGKFCVYDGEKKVKSFPDRKAAQAFIDSGEDEGAEEDKKKMPPKMMSKQTKPGGRGMDQQEFDEQMKSHIEQLKAELTKEYEYRVHKAREDGKAEAEMQAEALREEVRKLQAEKRSERIENWIKRMKTDGKLSPAEESKVRALREWIPDEDTSLKFFSLTNGKTVEHAGSPAEIFEGLFEARPSAFKVYSKDGTEEDDAGKELEDAGAEVDRRAKLYQQKQAQANTPVNYGVALSYVLKTDKDLAHRYHQMQRQ